MIALPTATPEDVGLSHAGLERIDEAVQAHIDAGAIAGAVTLTMRHGRLVRHRAMGAKDLVTSEPMAPDTMFRIFSMTKPVTAVAMMILHDRGLWRPEEPIARHLPELADLQVLAARDAAGRPILVPAAHPPTMQELMTNTAGFAYGIDPTDPLHDLYQAVKPLDADDLPDMVQRLATLPLGYQPGSAWRYSVSMDVQGAIVERLTGRSLPEFMAEEIFAPLGMADTAFHTPPEKARRLATLYFRDGDGPLVAIPNPLRPDHDAVPRLALGGGGLVSTAGDYARFGQMILDGGMAGDRRIVSHDALRLMMSNHMPDAMMASGIKAGHHRFRPGFGYGYNGAVFIDPVLADMPVGRGTYQWDGAAGTWFWIDPENDLLFVGMVQMLSWTPPALQAETQMLMGETLAASRPAVRRTSPFHTAE